MNEYAHLMWSDEKRLEMRNELRNVNSPLRKKIETRLSAKDEEKPVVKSQLIFDTKRRFK